MFFFYNFISETQSETFTDKKIIFKDKKGKIAKIRKMSVKVHTEEKLSEKTRKKEVR